MFLLLILSLVAIVAGGVLFAASALLSGVRAGSPSDDADLRAPAPLRVLMAPAGTAVVLPAFVTAPDGEVQPRWRWDDAGTVPPGRRAA